MANKQHAQFSDENGNIFYLENETEDVLDPSGKPLSNGGDLSEASVTFTPDATRKLPQSGGRFKAFLGSIVKYLTDLGAAAYLAVANNCTTTQAGSLLDARQGKVLMDKANQLSSELLKVSSIGMIFTDYNGYALEKSIAYVIDRMRNSGTQFATATFNSNDVWYLLMAHIEGSGRASGIVKDAYGAPMYNMWRWEGADAVLKKLGSNPVPINFSFNSSEYAGNTGESYPRITLTYSLSEFSSLDLSISRAISGSSTPWSGSVAIDGITIWSKEMNNDNTPFSVSNYDVSGKNTLTISIENRASQSNSSTISVTGTIK